MQNLHITCDNLKQRQNVFNILDGMGLKSDDAPYDFLQINARINDTENPFYMTVIKGDVWNNSEIISYTQFMEQYAMQKLKNIIKESGLSNPELSIKLGHSRKYLTNLLNDGCSTELQNRLIHEISEVIAGTFKTDAEVIAELTQRLSEAQDSNIKLMQESDGYHNANTELNQELNTVRKNAQEADRALKKAKDDPDYIKEENDQLREAISELRKQTKTQNVLAWCAVLVIMVLSYFLWSK